MSILDKLKIVDHVPTAAAVGAVSPVDRGRFKLIDELSIQIELAKNPEYKVVKGINKRDGTTEKSERKPRSWVTVDDEYAYIGVRISNKLVPVGGANGSFVRCKRDEVINTLEVLRQWAESGEADDLIQETMLKSKRKKS